LVAPCNTRLRSRRLKGRGNPGTHPLPHSVIPVWESLGRSLPRGLRNIAKRSGPAGVAPASRAAEHSNGRTSCCCLLSGQRRYEHLRCTWPRSSTDKNRDWRVGQSRSFIVKQHRHAVIVLPPGSLTGPTPTHSLTSRKEESRSHRHERPLITLAVKSRLVFRWPLLSQRRARCLAGIPSRFGFNPSPERASLSDFHDGQSQSPLPLRASRGAGTDDERVWILATAESVAGAGRIRTLRLSTDDAADQLPERLARRSGGLPKPLRSVRHDRRHRSLPRVRQWLVSAAPATRPRRLTSGTLTSRGVAAGRKDPPSVLASKLHLIVPRWFRGYRVFPFD
jgi:hypothetical protein